MPRYKIAPNEVIIVQKMKDASVPEVIFYESFSAPVEVRS